MGRTHVVVRLGVGDGEIGLVDRRGIDTLDVIKFWTQHGTKISMVLLRRKHYTQVNTTMLEKRRKSHKSSVCITTISNLVQPSTQHAQPSLAPSVLALPKLTRASSCLPARFVWPPTPRGPLRLVSGMAFAIAVKTSATFCPVLALVSKNSRLSSSA